MTEKQRFMIYIKLGNLISSVKKKFNLSTGEALKYLLDKEIVQELEDLETGYYLEGSAYLEEVFKLS